MRVLVTGAGGILGRAAVDAIERAGFNVLAVVSPAKNETSDGAIPVDLTTDRLVEKVPQTDAIVHLAAAVPHNRKYRDDATAGRLTDLIDQNVCEYAREAGAYVVYSSGCSLYDNADPSWKSESSEVRAKSSYQRSKYATEQTLLKNSNACVFRSSTPYGPGIFISTVLGQFIDRARQHRPLEVWGSGTREQDFVHAQDVAQFILAALKHRPTGLYNVAYGHPITMEQLARLIVKSAGGGEVLTTGRHDPQEGATARFLVGKAQAELGWVPGIQLNEALRDLQALPFRQ